MSSEDVVKFSESTFSPDAESSDVSSWSELEKIKSANVDGLNTGNVSKSSNKWDILSTINDKWTSSGSVSSVSKFSKTSSDFN